MVHIKKKKKTNLKNAHMFSALFLSFEFFFFGGGEVHLLYNVVLASPVQQSESAI